MFPCNILNQVGEKFVIFWIWCDIVDLVFEVGRKNYPVCFLEIETALVRHKQKRGDYSRSVHVAIPISFAANSATSSSYKFSLYSNQCRAETGRDVIVKAIFKADFFQSR